MTEGQSPNTLTTSVLSIEQPAPNSLNNRGQTTFLASVTMRELWFTPKFFIQFFCTSPTPHDGVADALKFGDVHFHRLRAGSANEPHHACEKMNRAVETL